MANVRDMGSPAKLGTKSITVNGTYNASSDNLDGFSQVSVDVPSAVLGTKSITENGKYNASSDNLNGYSQVIVNVPEAVLGTKSITENGTYNASSDNLNGYSQVTVNISENMPKSVPYKTRLYSGWYINSAGYYVNDPSDPHAVTISFPVESGHKYMIFTGTYRYPNRNRYGFYPTDIVANPEYVGLSDFSSYLTDSSKIYNVIDNIAQDGFLIGYIALPNPDDGTVVYLLDITGMDIDGSIA